MLNSEIHGNLRRFLTSLKCSPYQQRTSPNRPQEKLNEKKHKRNRVSFYAKRQQGQQEHTKLIYRTTVLTYVSLLGVSERSVAMFIAVVKPVSRKALFLSTDVIKASTACACTAAIVKETVTATSYRKVGCALLEALTKVKIVCAKLPQRSFKQKLIKQNAMLLNCMYKQNSLR